MTEEPHNVLNVKDEEKILSQTAVIVDASPDAIIGETVDGVITSWNGGALKMFGYLPEEVIGKPISSLFPFELKDELSQLFEKVKHGEVITNYVSSWLRKDGTRIELEFSISPVCTPSGVNIGVSLVGRDISARKKREETLRQIQLVVDSANDAIIGIIGETLDGVITNWNGGAQKMFGYTEQEAIGKPISFLLPPETKDEASKLLNTVISGEVVNDYDTVWTRKDGSKVDVSLSISPIRSKDGVIIGASVVERDITKRKWYELHNQRMTQLYAALSKGNQAIVHSTNENELFQEICSAAVKFGGMMTAWVGVLDEGTGKVSSVASFGAGVEYLPELQISVDVNDPLGRGPTGTAIRENRPVWSQDIQQDQNTAPWHDFAKAAGWRAGASLPLLRNGVPLGSLTLYSGVVNAFDDDAQRLLTEMSSDVSFALDNFTSRENLQKSEESLRQTQSIVDHSQDAIFGASLEGVALSWNSGAQKMFGYSAEEIIGKPLIVLFTPERLRDLPFFIGEIRQKKHVLNFEAPALRKDGSIIWISLSISPITKKDGSVTSASVVIRDITELKKTEEHIKELNEVRSKFIDIISHQLQTPLTVVNWNLEAVLNGEFGKLEDVTHDFLQATHRSSVDITKRIRDLLMAIDIEEGRVVFRKDDVALDSIVASVVSEMGNKCALKNISFTYIAPEKDLPAIVGDSEKIRTVITKIVENAIIYTKENGNIAAKLEETGGVFRFEVKDNGVGIPEQEQHRVFTRFFRASNASVMQPDAFGLGLYVSKNFVEQHGGKIGFESREGEGSTFWFEIPLKTNVR